MSLTKIPTEDSEEKIIYRIYKNEQMTLIEVYASDELICAVDNFVDWINAFREHYEQITGEEIGISHFKAPQVHGANIPDDSGRIVFEVDRGHSCLRFRIGKEDDKARGIIDKFINRIRKTV